MTRRFVLVLVVAIALVVAVQPRFASALISGVFAAGQPIPEETPQGWFLTPAPLPTDTYPPTPIITLPPPPPEPSAVPIEVTAPPETAAPLPSEETLPPEESPAPRLPPIPAVPLPRRNAVPIQAPTAAPIQNPTPIPIEAPPPVLRRAPNPELVAKLAADRETLAVLVETRGRLARELLKVEHISEQQRDYRTEMLEMRRQVAEDTLLDATDVLGSDQVLARLRVPRGSTELVKAILARVKDGINVAAVYNASQSKDADAQKRADEKLRSIRASALSELAGAAGLPAETTENLKKFIDSSYAVINGSATYADSQTALQKVDSVMDTVAAVVGAVNPTVGVLRAGVNTTFGAATWGYIWYQGRSIEAATGSAQRAKTSLEAHIGDLEQREAAAQQAIGQDQQQLSH